MSTPVIPGYDGLEPLGEGGMGTVYKATQVSLDRTVALKVLPLGDSVEQSDIERFKQEAKGAAQLNHPNLVQVYDAGEAEGVCYFAMEYVKGRTVHTEIKRKGTLPESYALVVAESVAMALEHAWDKARIVHRDIKPENILIDADGVVKVADLGLLKMVGRDKGTTVSGDVLCTPNYCSPEQAEGDPNLDCRSDMYSLGATLYHMLTGKLPFASSQGTGPMIKHVTAQLADVRDVNPEVSAGTAMLIRKLMAKRAEHRHSGWAGVVQDIESVAGGGKPANPLPTNVKSTIKSFRTNTTVQPTARKEPPAQAQAPAPEQDTRVQDLVVMLKKPPVIAGMAAGALVIVLLLVILTSMSKRPSAREETALQKEARVGRLFKEAERQCRLHPENYDENIKRMDGVARQAWETRYEQVIENRVAELKAGKKRAAAEIVDRLKREAEELVIAGRPQDAARLCRAYDGPLAPETKQRREMLALKMVAAAAPPAAVPAVREEPTVAMVPKVPEPVEEVSEEDPEKTPVAVRENEKWVEEPVQAEPDEGDRSELEKLQGTLAKLQGKIDADYEARIAALFARYSKRLDALEQAVRARGDLDGVLALQAERRRFEEHKTIPESVAEGLPSDLGEVRRLYGRTIAKVQVDSSKSTTSLLRRYVQALEPLKVKLVRGDRVADARKVQEEIEAIDLRIASLDEKVASLDKSRTARKDRPRRRLGPVKLKNVATEARIEASSVYHDRPGWAASLVADGIKGKESAGMQWASWGEGGPGGKHPWIKLTWKSPQMVHKVLLYDRVGAARVIGATLEFGRLETVKVGPLPDNGATAGEVELEEPVKTTWIKITIDDSTSGNIGFAEVEVFAEAD